MCVGKNGTYSFLWWARKIVYAGNDCVCIFNRITSGEVRIMIVCVGKNGTRRLLLVFVVNM